MSLRVLLRNERIPHLCRLPESARDIEVSTRSGTIDDLGDNNDQEAEDNVVFLPSTAQTYSLWYKRCYIMISRDRVMNGGPFGRPKDYIQIRYGPLAYGGLVAANDCPYILAV